MLAAHGDASATGLGSSRLQDASVAKQYDRLTIRADGLDGKRAAQYEATVLGMLHSYEQMQMGRAIMQALRFVRREVLIYPYDGGLGHCNAYVYNDWGMFRTKLSFTAADFVGRSACYPDHAAGTTPHEVLFHELVHAMRDAAGKRLSYKGHAGEEAIAVMVTNIFSSEVHRPLRRDWNGFIQMSVSSEDFFAAHGDMIRVFYHQHPEFCRWIAEAAAPFNPLRTYYRTLRGVPRLRSA
jgi:hypothetical protein